MSKLTPNPASTAPVQEATSEAQSNLVEPFLNAAAALEYLRKSECMDGLKLSAQFALTGRTLQALQKVNKDRTLRTHICKVDLSALEREYEQRA